MHYDTATTNDEINVGKNI